ncbi:MAG: cobalamin B12-binding domain-containing protein [Candidatus Riflebacteria bacterium]|nr:cobalamin B12-binding domain-containing protein [Candidatus Riflebacteria bacterium]
MNPDRLLLTSVFKPFGVDDAFGVKENLCEVMHNQVTRGQGVFSIRAHLRSFGLTFMAENLQVPTTVLDFPTVEEFATELRRGPYSHVGISFIVPNFDKARHMAQLVRKVSPGTRILLGGHGTTIPDLDRQIPNDGVCRGEGVRWLRERFGEPVDRPLVHPAMKVDCWRRLLGAPAPHNKAILIPGVGCKNRCSFCCTSHFFDGYRSLFPDAEGLFAAMERIADRVGTRQFFVLDENFLDDRDKVEKIVSLMASRNRRFNLDIFSSLRTVASYDPVTLLRLGVQFVWIGIESQKELFDKVKGVDAVRVVRDLRRHGISVLASTILFLDHHDRSSLEQDVEYAIGLEPDFIQFMELAPLPGTATYEKLEDEGRILKDVPYREWHGQDKIWFSHPHFSRDETRELLDGAFEREYLRLGPSLLRTAETRIQALDLVVPAPDELLAARLADLREAAAEMRPLLPAMVRLAPNDAIRRKAEDVDARYRKHFGAPSVTERVVSTFVLWFARLEEWRIRHGRAGHQPPTFVDRYRQ